MRLTRRQALVAGAAAPLALTGTARADDLQKKQAVTWLAQALRLEQSAAVAYEAIANGGYLDVRASDLFRQFRAQDAVHAQKLTMGLQQLGAKTAIAPARAAIPGLAGVHDRPTALRFAISLEEQAIAAYLAAAPFVADVNLLLTAIGAMGTDAQQLAVLRQLAGENPVPTAFEHGSRR